MSNGEQQRNMRRLAGLCRFVFNKALALQNDLGPMRVRVPPATGVNGGFSWLCHAPDPDGHAP